MATIMFMQASAWRVRIQDVTVIRQNVLSTETYATWNRDTVHFLSVESRGNQNVREKSLTDFSSSCRNQNFSVGPFSHTSTMYTSQIPYRISNCILCLCVGSWINTLVAVQLVKDNSMYVSVIWSWNAHAVLVVYACYKSTYVLAV